MAGPGRSRRERSVGASYFRLMPARSATGEWHDAQFPTPLKYVRPACASPAGACADVTTSSLYFACWRRKVNVSREISHFFCGQIAIARHRCLEIRQSRPDQRSDRLSILIEADQGRVHQVGCSHGRLCEIGAVTEVAVVKDVNGAAALERRGGRLVAAGVLLRWLLLSREQPRGREEQNRGDD